MLRLSSKWPAVVNVAKLNDGVRWKWGEGGGIVNVLSEDLMCLLHWTKHHYGLLSLSVSALSRREVSRSIHEE